MDKTLIHNFLYSVAYLSCYDEKVIKALCNQLALGLPATCLPYQDGESQYVSFPTAQQADLPACFPHCPFIVERQAGKQ